MLAPVTYPEIRVAARVLKASPVTPDHPGDRWISDAIGTSRISVCLVSIATPFTVCLCVLYIFLSTFLTLLLSVQPP